MPQLSPLIAIVGSTASGKTELALRLAKIFDGEIISADSRLIYREMNIATGKLDGDLEKKTEDGGIVYYNNHTPIYLMDLITPAEKFSVARFKRLAEAKIADIHARGKLPFLVGGTGLYIDAVTDNFLIPPNQANYAIRNHLSRLTAAELFAKLQKLDPAAAEKITVCNPRKLLRALEVCELSGQKFSELKQRSQPLYRTLKMAPQVEREILYARIDERVDKMLATGLVQETQALRKKYAADLPAMTGIGYREIGEHLEKQISLPEAVQKIKFRTHQYARRQLTWFKKDTTIQWITNQTEAEKLVENFLSERKEETPEK